MVAETHRRRFLSLLLGAGSATVLGRFAVGQAAAQQSVDIYLGGEVGAWHGRSPSSIEGTENPTLKLREGETYVLAWQNVDSDPHNFVIENENGDNLVETAIMSEKDAIQRVEFTVTNEMVHYYCQVHPGSMAGPVEVVPADSGEGIPPDDGITVTDVPTETESATPTTTTTTTTEDPGTESATEPPTESTAGGDGGDGGGGTTSGSGPGFGVLSTVAGLAGAAKLLFDRTGGD